MIKILAIDDINDNLIILKAIISDAFPDSMVFTAQNGSQGIELAIAHDPDVILLDILMPGLDGFEVCRRLKQDEKLQDIPVVFITALRGDKRNRINALEVGADAIISKSIDEPELTAQIRAMIKTKAANKEKRHEKERLTALLSECTRQLENEREKRKLAEDRLRECEMKSYGTFDQSPVGSVIVGLDKRFIKCNAAFCHFLGYTEDELIGKTISEVTYPEDVELGMLDLKLMIEGKKESSIFQKRYLHKDGTIVWGEISISLVRDRENKPMYFMPVIQDITERNRTEEELKTSQEIFNQFMENSPIYIFFKDENIRSLRLSRNYEKMLGKNINELLGKSMNELFPSDVAVKMVEDDIQILKEGKKIEIEEKFDGRYYSTIKFPIQIEEKPRFLAGFTIDITENKLAQETLRKNEIHLRELNATKDKFFSIISHDLKSPFNSILGFTELLVEKIHNQDYEGIENYASIIQNSSTRAMDLLMNLLVWSRSQTGSIPFDPDYVEIDTLINEETELLNNTALQKSITISNENQQNVTIFADKAMVGTILRNLISNAIKFTFPGGKVVVSAEKKKNELEITVSDNGVGIKKATIEKLFRIDETHTTEGTRNERGTGLGLILCKEFVEKHGGKIWCESEPDKGSRFYFTIPLKN